MKTRYDVIIIGAGAAGLSAANRLLQIDKNMDVLLVEKEDVPGRKLSASGNGKCNLTNDDYDVRHYHGTDGERIKQLISAFSKEQVLEFVNGLGILTYEKNGYYYPVSNQAKQVTALLMEAIERMGITYLGGAKVEEIKKANEDDPQNEGRYYITARTSKHGVKQYSCDFLIVATGGLASQALGGSLDGYHLAESLHIKCSELYPALAPIYVEDAFLSIAKGVRLDGVVSLMTSEGNWIKERGQIQFNRDCLSGICIMNVSGCSHKLLPIQRENALFVDCLPDRSWNALTDYVIERQAACPKQTLHAFLSGIFPLPFVGYLLKRLSLKGELLLEGLTEKNRNRLVSSIKKLTFTPCVCKRGKEKNGSYDEAGFEEAQVTGGGVLLSELALPSCESITYPGLYLVGELLDVYGDCGGYNLTFAICSGLVAAEDIARK